MSALVRLVVCLLLVTAGAARADDVADFNAAVEKAAAHNRVAIGYLRNDNIDLAGLELDRLREAWRGVSERKRPDAFRDTALYTTVMTDIATRLVSADMMMNMGKPDVARDALTGIRDNLYKLRKSAGIVVLADCVKDSNMIMEGLVPYDDRAADWSSAAVLSDVAAKAKAYGETLTRCDGLADAATRNDPEFRRLIDGAKTELAHIPRVVSDRDGDLFHRVMGSLRAIDNLLTFRFG